MQNDPELNGKFLGTITEDFIKVSDFLKESSYQIRKRGFSKYPIFVLSHKMIELGLPLIIKDERDNKWYYNAALPEHLIEKELLLEDRLEEFDAIYKDPEEYCCLFVILPEFSNFVFLPYPDEDGLLEE
jgi:hypothetical protein